MLLVVNNSSVFTYYTLYTVSKMIYNHVTVNAIQKQDTIDIVPT